MEDSIQQALLKCEEYGFPTERRIRLKKRMAGEQARDSGFTLQEENKRTMLECIDHFHNELEIQSKAIKDVTTLFGVIQTKNLVQATEEELEVMVSRLTVFYNEICKNEPVLEIPRLRRHLQAADVDLEKVKHWTTLDALTFIAEWNFIKSLPTLTLPKVAPYYMFLWHHVKGVS